MPAFLLCELYYQPLLGVGDVRITHASLDPKHDIAALFGVAHPTDLVNRFLSDFQDFDWREYGRTRWALRQLGYAIPPDYCTMVRGPGGQMIGQRRELASTWVGEEREAYLMRVEPIREVDHLPVLRYDDYGVDKAAAEAITGLRSVAQLRSQLATDKMSLPFGERFTTILSRCDRLVKQKRVKAPTALDAALHPKVGWSLDGKKAPVVTVHQTCPRCAWQWHYGGVDTPNQCPRCRLRPDTGAPP